MKLILPAAVERKLNAYVQGVDAEVAGMGKVEVRDDGNLWVLDVAIYDQEVTAGTADLSTEALASFLNELVKKGENPRQWYLWWHSHHTMAAFFSGTDTGTIESSTEFDHVLSLVVNRRRERRARFDTHRINGLPIRMSLENLTIEIAPEINNTSTVVEEELTTLRARIAELCRLKDAEANKLPDVSAEIAEKVRHKVYKAPVGFHAGQYSGSHSHQKGRAYLNDDYDDAWSKNKKKDGDVTTAKDVIEKYDIDEIELMIDETKKLINAHRAHGNADSPECEQLKDDLKTYIDMFLDMTIGRQLDEYEFTAEDVLETDSQGFLILPSRYKEEEPE